MENASKALIMAGSVLLAIIIAALLYSFVNTLSRQKEAEDVQQLAKQTEAFNKEYESFEKSLMRGTDLITVINKAISNNQKYIDDDPAYTIDIRFTLKKPIYEVQVKVVDGKVQDPVEVPNTGLGENKQYSILNEDDLAVIKEFMKIDTYNTDRQEEWKKIDIKTARTFTKSYGQMTVFKRRFFKCTNVEYSEETGRVNLMEFEEIETSDGLEGFN